MRKSRARLWALTTGVLLSITALAGPAHAAPIVNPDLTIEGFTISTLFSGDFSASCATCLLSWTDAAGNFGGTDIGPMAFDWSQASANGSFSLSGAGAGFSLSGPVTSLVSNGVGGYVARVDLTDTALDLGHAVRITFVSTTTGYTAGLIPVPEPSTVALMASGLLAVAGLRRARARRRA